ASSLTRPTSRSEFIVCRTSSSCNLNESPMKYPRILCLIAALVALAACQQKSPSGTASESSSSSPTVASVDGTPISRDFYEFYIKGVTGKTSSDLSPEQRS